MYIVHTQQSTYHYSERTLFRLINMKMSAKMVPWEMARYQPIFTLSFLSSSTCVSIKIIRICLLQHQFLTSIGTLQHQHKHKRQHLHPHQLPPASALASSPHQHQLCPPHLSDHQSDHLSQLALKHHHPLLSGENAYMTISAFQTLRRPRES